MLVVAVSLKKQSQNMRRGAAMIGAMVCTFCDFNMLHLVYSNELFIVSHFFLLLLVIHVIVLFFFSSRRRHTRSLCDWSSDVCSSDLIDRVPPSLELDMRLEPQRPH